MNVDHSTCIDSGLFQTSCILFDVQKRFHAFQLEISTTNFTEFNLLRDTEGGS